MRDLHYTYTAPTGRLFFLNASGEIQENANDLIGTGKNINAILTDSELVDCMASLKKHFDDRAAADREAARIAREKREREKPAAPAPVPGNGGAKPHGHGSGKAVAASDNKVVGIISGNKITFEGLTLPEKKKLKTISAERQYSENYYSMTDRGNAQRIYDEYGSTLDYVHELGKFAHFDGVVHIVDESEKRIHEIYKETGERMVDEAFRIEGKDAREAALKWCRQSEFFKVFSSTIAHLQRMTAHSIHEYDVDDYEILCLNGALDLKEIKLTPSSPEQKHLKVVRAKYDPEAKAPRWEQFIEEVTSKDGTPRPELAHYLHKVLGYCLTADTSEKCIFFFYGGTGDNGKSTLITVIEYILGPYAQRISSTSLMKKKFGSNEIRNDLAKLIGSRFVAGSEVSKNNIFDDGIIRDLVGGDSITCRFLRQEFFTYEPKYKLFLYGNNKPRIDADDPAIRNKIKMIPFDFQPATVDKKLKKTLKAEADGIFNWLVEGLRMYRDEGLTDPEEIKEITKEYFDHNDFIARFIAENYEVVGIDEGNVSKISLYEAYTEWAMGEGVKKPLSKNAFGSRMIGKGFKDASVKKDGKTARVWLGLKGGKGESEEQLDVPF
ncbi:MAG: hypothetical protein JXA20_05495 [Spirochaetes bacterium]|nr:hypothetical protein [Spirochaetota bacterium]